jgi:hypothetical protein
VKSDKPRLLVILGPTASGKSKLGMDIAEGLRSEIVSADSLQLYRHLDIGTAKPSREERGIVPHHMIGIIDPDEDFNAGKYRQRRSIEELHAREGITRRRDLSLCQGPAAAHRRLPRIRKSNSLKARAEFGTEYV